MCLNTKFQALFDIDLVPELFFCVMKRRKILRIVNIGQWLLLGGVIVDSIRGPILDISFRSVFLDSIVHMIGKT